MLVQDWRDFFGETGKMDDFFNTAIKVLNDFCTTKDTCECESERRIKWSDPIDIGILDDDKIEFKDGKLYITRDGKNCALAIGCNKWNRVIDAIAKGVIEDTRVKKKEQQDKEFVANLVEEVDTLLQNTPDDNVLQVILSEEAYDLLKQYDANVFVSWKSRFKIKRKNICPKSEQKPLNYKIWIEDVNSGEATSFQGYAGFTWGGDETTDVEYEDGGNE